MWKSEGNDTFHSIEHLEKLFVRLNFKSNIYLFKQKNYNYAFSVLHTESEMLFWGLRLLKFTHFFVVVAK